MILAIARVTLDLPPRLLLKLGDELVDLGEGQEPDAPEDQVGLVDGHGEVDLFHGCLRPLRVCACKPGQIYFALPNRGATVPFH